MTTAYSCAGTLTAKASIADLRYDYGLKTTHTVGDFSYFFDNSNPSGCPVYDCSLTLSTGADASEHGPKLDSLGNLFTVVVSINEN